MICFDIVGLMPINDISREAGDLAILESLKRIEHNKEISLSLRAGLCKVPDGNLRYNEFFEEMHEAINSVRKKER